MYKKTILSKIKELQQLRVQLNTPAKNIAQCPKCHGTNKIILNDKEIEERKQLSYKIGVDFTKINFKPCDCINPDYKLYQQTIQDLKIYTSIYQNINVLEKYQHFCFEMYKPTVHKNVIELIKNKFFFNDIGPKTGFLFWSSGAGTGKTLLALSIMHAMMVEHKMPGRYENTTFMFHRLKDFFNKDRDDIYYNELDYLEQLANVKILILDDIGTEKASDWIREKLYYVLEARNIFDPQDHQNNKITLLTSNDSPDELTIKLGDKIVSRIFEYNQILEFEGTDWRQKKKK